MSLQALIFDVDGTLAETEEAHRRAFNEAFRSLGLPWTWSPSLYRELLSVTGGKERIFHYLSYWRPQEVALHRAAISKIYVQKTKRFVAMVKDGAVGLRPGVARLIQEARAAGITLAIATTTNRSNVAALLRRAFPSCGDTIFSAIVAGDEVPAKKPAPDVFHAVLRHLALPPTACIVFEDSGNGVMAARRARLPVVVTPCAYTKGDDFAGAASVVSTLGEPNRRHRHLAGWKWPGGLVTLEALRARFASPDAVP